MSQSSITRNREDPTSADDQTFLDEQIEGFEQRTGVDVIPGEGDVVQGVEADLRRRSKDIQAGKGVFMTEEEAAGLARSSFNRAGDGPEVSTIFSDKSVPIGTAEQQIAEGFARRAAGAQDVPGAVLSGGKLVESAGESTFNAGLDEFLPEEGEPLAKSEVPVSGKDLGTLQSEGETKLTEQRTATVGAVREAKESTVESFEERPFETLGSAGFEIAAAGGGYAAGAAASRGIGKVGRISRDRVRTAGGERIDVNEVAQEDVVKFRETGGAEGDEFPGAEDPSLYRSDPAAAVREQADRYTPESVTQFFDERGFGEGAVLKKGLDVEPEGPARGRASRGFEATPDEVPTAKDPSPDFSYENPGAFFGPELSPNFLRTGGRSFSLRPGLPDFGSSPTGVLARTDVELPDATTQDEFVSELRERAGETTARTKPAGVGSPGEIEAVVPPGGEFVPVSSGGRLTSLARRAGIGADFYTSVEGRRIPLRTVVPADKTPDVTDAIDGSVDDALGGGSAARGRSLDAYIESPTTPQDRPLPLFSVSAGTSALSPSNSSRAASAPPAPTGVSGTSAPNSTKDIDAAIQPTSSTGPTESEVTSPVGGAPGGSSVPSSEPTSGGSAGSPPSSGLSGGGSSGGGPSGSGGSGQPGSPGGSGVPSSPSSPGSPGSPGSPSQGIPGSPSGPPGSPTRQLPDFEPESNTGKRKRRRRMGDFEKDFSSAVATPDEVLSSDIAAADTDIPEEEPL